MDEFLKCGGNRRTYNNLLKASGEVEQSRARCEFLDQCKTEKVIPPTCRVKNSVKTNLSKSSQEKRNKNALKASIKEIEISLEDEKENFTNKVRQVMEKLAKIKESFPEDRANETLVCLNRKKEEQYNFYKRQFCSKFDFLRNKQYPESREGAEEGEGVVEEEGGVEQEATEVVVEHLAEEQEESLGEMVEVARWRG